MNLNQKLTKNVGFGCFNWFSRRFYNISRDVYLRRLWIVWIVDVKDGLVLPKNQPSCLEKLGTETLSRSSSSRPQALATLGIPTPQRKGGEMGGGGGGNSAFSDIMSGTVAGFAQVAVGEKFYERSIIPILQQQKPFYYSISRCSLAVRLSLSISRRIDSGRLGVWFCWGLLVKKREICANCVFARRFWCSNETKY